jgi:hypothetical protein
MQYGRSAPLYRSLRDACAKLDARSTRYQFDLEADVAWDRTSDPGHHFPRGFLADLGVDVDALAAHPPAWELFQWAFAIGMSEMFIGLENVIVTFLEDEAQQLERTRSLELLYDEERKHVAMFRRYAALLRTQRPEAAAKLDGPLAESMARLPIFPPGTEADRAQRHYMLWLAAVFFEEYSIYFADRLLDEEGARAQPAWVSMHSAHRREEIQHLATDARHVEMLDIDERGRAQVSRMFVIGMTRNFGHVLAVSAPAGLVAQAHPEFGNGALTKPPPRTTLYRDILYDAPQFRRTRSMLTGSGSLAVPA